jgi:DHA2 family multidrug resistance protein-like MFS transporter
MLIASRALLGLAGATLAPSTLSLIFSIFQDPKQRSVAIAVWISAFSAGSAIGPLLGGVLLEHFWWGSVFLLAVPVMALLLVLGPIILPEYRDPKAGRLDLASAIISLIAVLAMIFGLKLIAQDGVGWLAVSSALIGLLLGILFVRRQLTLADPMIDLSLFRIPAFSASLVVNVLAVFVAIGYFLFVAQYLQLVLGLSPLQAGFWSLPSAVAFIAGSNLVPRIVRRVRPAFVIGAGLGLAAVGLGVLAQAGGADGLATVVTASVIISLGLAPVFGLTTELVVGSAPAERAGAASGIAETASELGGALGISILGSIGVALYRTRVAAALPINLPPEAAEVARDTLGAAVGVARQLPDELGGPLLELASGAFVQGMQVAAAISAIVALSAAALAVAMLHRVRAGSEPAGQPDLAPERMIAGSACGELTPCPVAAPEKW